MPAARPMAGQVAFSGAPATMESHMLHLIHRAAPSLAAATLATALVLASPIAAATDAQPTTGGQSGAPLLLAQTNPTTPAQPSTTKKPRRPRVDIETRIKQLHDQLKITPAQEQQWGAVAQAMRDDAKDMQTAIEKRRQNRNKMNAVDDLRSYQEVAETHVQGLQKLIPAFQALYDSMSDDQKKNADAVFSRSRRARQAAPKQH